MKRFDYPSPLAQIVVRGKGGSRQASLPSRELFRVDAIFNAHEYAIPRHYLPSSALTVVDVGANVGLFALYMKLRHHTDAIHCFEPTPASLDLLKRNVNGLDGIYLHPFGLTDRDGGAKLALHPQNSGQNRLVIGSGSDKAYMDVMVRDASTAFDRIGLTYIDVLKIDTEGCEVSILESLQSRLAYVGIVLLEYHSESDRRRIDQLLEGFTLFGAKVTMTDVGILKFINRRLLERCPVSSGTI